ncbi:MAG: MerR family transcriptional regulator [Chloroherpetonaceae bacterium]
MKTFETKKLYYSIGEVSKIVGLPAYLLRAWEDEFPQLAPSRNSKGNRIYTNKDVATILSIKNLVYEQGYTAERAKALLQHEPQPEVEKQTQDALKEYQPSVKPTRASAVIQRERKLLLEIKQELESLLERFK